MKAGDFVRPEVKKIRLRKGFSEKHSETEESVWNTVSVVRVYIFPDVA